MRTLASITIAVAITCAAAPAFAWDGPDMWYRAADDPNPGGGGILGTGGAHDSGIKCTDCHVDRVAEPNLAFAMTFSPALVGQAYVPGQRYTITAMLTGAQQGIGCGQSDPNMHNRDGFAASFEDVTGAPVGALASDSGGNQTNCTLSSPPPPGTTALSGDCKVIYAMSTENVDTWTFTWTAPAAGAVRIYWGAVDGNCDMMSMKDAAVTGSLTLAPPPMARSSSPGHGSWAILTLPLFGLVLVPRRRR